MRLPIKPEGAPARSLTDMLDDINRDIQQATLAYLKRERLRLVECNSYHPSLRTYGIRLEVVDLNTDSLHDFVYETIIDVLRDMGQDDLVFLYREPPRVTRLDSGEFMLRIRFGVVHEDDFKLEERHLSDK